uniref:Glutaredoxin domain-containing protein n=1 Tax=Romanomermis culicivorax TaxID=13658 RepID=A0A915KDC8_ROMCU
MPTFDDTFQKQVADNPVVVYSKSTCGYCTEARKLFDKERIPYFSYDIDKNEDGMDVFKSIHAVTKSRYVPQIFICGKYVG